MLLTRALAYVPSRPKRATGGFESTAGAAYVRIAVRGSEGAVRRTAAVKAGRMTREDIIFEDLELDNAPD